LFPGRRQLLDELEDKSVLLSDQPRLGPSRQDISPEMQYLPAGSYLILYRIIEGGIEVVRVVHSARRLADIIIDE
jgi:toxin ParE1/3/4